MEGDGLSRNYRASSIGKKEQERRDRACSFTKKRKETKIERNREHRKRLTFEKQMLVVIYRGSHVANPKQNGRVIFNLRPRPSCTLHDPPCTQLIHATPPTQPSHRRVPAKPTPHGGGCRSATPKAEGIQHVDSSSRSIIHYARPRRNTK